MHGSLVIWENGGPPRTITLEKQHMTADEVNDQFRREGIGHLVRMLTPEEILAKLALLRDDDLAVLVDMLTEVSEDD